MLDKGFFFNPNDISFIEDPYPTYKLLRECEPIHKSPMGYWVLTQYSTILGTLHDKRFSNEPSIYAVLNKKNSTRYISAKIANNTIPFQDPPLQKINRRLISRAYFSYLKQYPLDIQATAKELLFSVLQKGEIDLIQDYAKPLSVKTTSLLLGVPEQDEKKLEAWSEYFFYLFVPIPSQEILSKMEVALTEFKQYFEELVINRSKDPKNDLISHLLSVIDGDERLSIDQIVDTCMLLFADGVENIDSSIANTLLLLINHPKQFQILLNNPELLSSAIEEALRIDPPAQLIARIAKEDILIEDKLIKKNEAVLLVLAAANRDPVQFTDPDVFNIQRETNEHITFGSGKHACIGGGLATEQITVGIKILIQHLNNIKLKNGMPKRVHRFGHRWFDEFIIKFN